MAETESHSEPLLSLLVKLVNEGKYLSFPVSIVTYGTTISGNLISEERYYSKMCEDAHKQSKSTEEVVEKTGSSKDEADEWSKAIHSVTTHLLTLIGAAPSEQSDYIFLEQSTKDGSGSTAPNKMFKLARSAIHGIHLDVSASPVNARDAVAGNP